MKIAMRLLREDVWQADIDCILNTRYGSSQAAPEHKTTLTHPAPGINNAQHSAVIFSVVGSAMREQKNNLIRETIWKNVVILYRVQFTCHGGH